MINLPFINQMPEDLRFALARILLALLALLAIWLLRRLLVWVLLRPLTWLAKRTKTQLDDALLAALIAPATLIVIAFGIQVSATILAVDAVGDVFVQHVTRSLVIVAVLFALIQVVDILTPSSARLFRLTGMTIPERLLPFIRTAAKVILVALIVVIIIQEWGYDVSGLIAGLGLGGLAISLAAKDTVENVFGFSAIIADNPFIVGEIIKMGDIEGTVEYVGIRSTHIRQLDQSLVIIPNSKLVGTPITNRSRMAWRWIDMTMRINAQIGHQQLQTLLERLRELLKSRPHVDANTAMVRFAAINGNSLEILVRCYIDLPDWGQFSLEREAINLEILKILEEMAISLA
jgi:MscS family membrane protein